MIEEFDNTFYDLEEIPRKNTEKINELIQYVNNLEEKLLAAEEQIDLEAANEALKRDKFIPLEDLEKELNSSEN